MELKNIWYFLSNLNSQTTFTLVSWEKIRLELRVNHDLVIKIIDMIGFGMLLPLFTQLCQVSAYYRTLIRLPIRI